MTPDRAEILSLRRVVRLANLDFAAALTSRAYWRARARRAEAALAMQEVDEDLLAETSARRLDRILAMRSDLKRAREDERVLSETLTRVRRELWHIVTLSGPDPVIIKGRIAQVVEMIPDPDGESGSRVAESA